MRPVRGAFGEPNIHLGFTTVTAVQCAISCYFVPRHAGNQLLVENTASKIYEYHIFGYINSSYFAYIYIYTLITQFCNILNGCEICMWPFVISDCKDISSWWHASLSVLPRFKIVIFSKYCPWLPVKSTGAKPSQTKPKGKLYVNLGM